MTSGDKVALLFAIALIWTFAFTLYFTYRGNHYIAKTFRRGKGLPEIRAFTKDVPPSILESYSDALVALFESKKLSRQAYWYNFNRLSFDFEFHEDWEILLDKSFLHESLTLRDTFIRILQNKYVTSEDIDRICYGPYKTMRHIALELPLCRKENKIVVALMDGGI